MYLRDGIYTLTSPFILDQKDSGTNGFTIMYRNYQGEVPMVSGGKQITGWQQDGNKWKANLGTDIKIRQLYVNGTRAIRARSAGGLPGTQQTSSGYTTTNISMQNWKNISGVEFVLGIDNWMQHRCGVQTIVGLSITMKYPCFNGVVGYTTGNKPLVQWIENAYELLDSPGEWYHDRSTGWLSYIPRPGEKMNTAFVVAPLLETLISGSGTPDNPIHNIQFQGIIFSYATWFGPETNEGFVHLQAHFISLPAWVPVPANITFKGIYAQAYMLYRLGYTDASGKNPFEVNDNALLRAVQYQWYLQNKFGGSWYDTGRAAWVKHLANKFYGFKPIQYSPIDGGRNMSLTQWTLQ